MHGQEWESLSNCPPDFSGLFPSPLALDLQLLVALLTPFSHLKIAWTNSLLKGINTSQNFLGIPGCSNASLYVPGREGGDLTCAVECSHCWFWIQPFKEDTEIQGKGVSLPRQLAPWCDQGSSWNFQDGPISSQLIGVVPGCSLSSASSFTFLSFPP